ncbi:winged helix-turn-helix transcriptional regulator [Rhizobium bangladeshense]|uniref:winged helix-turn-helix transcriptional regulator n=1 Tax=Rhizobium bangladeshense TaxID=1138189 RepID=UPI003CCFCDA8
MLTLTLRNLERDGLVARHYYTELPPRVEYELTDRGKSMLKLRDSPIGSATHGKISKPRVGSSMRPNNAGFRRSSDLLLRKLLAKSPRVEGILRLPVVAPHVIKKRPHGGAREAAAGVV